MFQKGETVWYTKPEQVVVTNNKDAFTDGSYTIARENGTEKETLSEFLSKEKPKCVKPSPSSKNPSTRKKSPSHQQAFAKGQHVWYVKPGQTDELVKITQVDTGITPPSYTILKENGSEKGTEEQYLRPLYYHMGGRRRGVKVKRTTQNHRKLP